METWSCWVSITKRLPVTRWLSCTGWYTMHFVIHTYHFSIKEDRIVLEIPEESSLIGASVSGDRRKIAFLYSGLVDPLMLVVLQASDYKEEVKVEKLLENCFENLFTFLKVLLSSKLKTGDASHKWDAVCTDPHPPWPWGDCVHAWRQLKAAVLHKVQASNSLFKDFYTNLSILSGALLVICPFKTPVVQNVLELPQLRATQVRWGLQMFSSRQHILNIFRWRSLIVISLVLVPERHLWCGLKKEKVQWRR